MSWREKKFPRPSSSWAANWRTRPAGRWPSGRRREGHWIGNHTYSHETPLGLLEGEDVAKREIGRTQDLIGPLSHPDKFFRPFGGGGVLGPHLLSPPVSDYLQSGKFTCVLWNVIPRDWDETDNDQWPERAMEIMAALDWALVVVHDLPTGAMNHLERFIGMVRDAGGTFRQDFPTNCLPIKRGKPTEGLAGYVSETAG